MRKTVILFFVIIGVLACNKNKKIAINYFNQQPPDSIPKVFAKGTISLEDRWEGNLSFSSDGKTCYFNVFQDSTKTIYTSNLVNDEWTKPVPFETIDAENNWEPFISLDGKEFYFISSRTPGTPEWNGRIWKMIKADNKWSKPKLIDFGLTTENGFWFPNTSKKGNLYFGGNFKEIGNQGNGDLYYYNKEDDKVYNIETLNTKYEEWDPLIAPDESFILWCSDREGGFGGTDIYISYKQSNGSWGNAVNLGDKINTPDYEVAPRLTPDGKYLFFDRPINGAQDIYWVSTNFIKKFKE